MRAKLACADYIRCEILCESDLFGSVRAVTPGHYFRWPMEATVDKFLHERNLEMYRAQLNCTTNDDTRRQLLRFISEERKHFLPKAGLTAPNFSFSRRDGSGGAAARRMSVKT